MSNPLRILLIEDNPDDELLLRRELRKGGLTVDAERVETVEELRTALRQDSWDLVISDYCLPTCNGIDTLAVVRRMQPQLPFILISGTVGEEVAVESIKAGANDYLLKQNLIRLVPAVNRAIRESEDNRRRASAERELFENQARLDLIYNTVSDFLVFITRTAEGRWVYTSANRAFVSKLMEVGIQVLPNQIIGLDCETVERDFFKLDEDSVEWLDQQRTLTLGGQSFRVQRELNLPNGKFTAEFTYNPIVDPDGVTRRVLVDGRDITEYLRQQAREKRMHEQLMQASKMEALGTLSGGIAHDFNNLLTGILGFGELTTATQSLDDAHTHATQIVRVATRAKDLVRQILTFSRSQSSTREPLFVAALLWEIVPLLRATLSKQIRLLTEAPEPGPIVMADSGQLHQVVLNLCTNAAHAMPRGGDLKLLITEEELGQEFCDEHPQLRPGKHARITVSDTGNGIPKDVMPRIFEPFFTTKAVGHGTGLGLSVVHGIIQNHDGAITVHSTPGVGTIFQIYLPIAETKLVSSARTTMHSGGKLERVLCLDDEPILAELVTNLLQALDYQATPVTDPEVALRCWNNGSEQFHVLLTDFKMPKLSGLEVIETLRKTHPKVPVILATGISDSFLLQKVEALGNVTILQKPYSRDQLARAMSKALKSS
ncbi:MAG: response regulator [Fimbriiglobus sp.]